MAKTAVEAALNQCALFRGMTPAERQELYGLLETLTYSAHDRILTEGESFQFLWVLVEGRCRVFKTTKNHEEKELGFIEPFGVFGEMSFFQPGPHSASVQALAPVVLVRLSRLQYDLLLRVGSLAAYKLAYNTMGVLIERLRKMDDKVAEVLATTSPGHREEWLDFQSKLYSGWQF
jgi:CRP/FNR family transcriptional regulator